MFKSKNSVGVRVKPLVSKSLDETRACAEEFLRDLKTSKLATVVGLSGDLGSGKTAFTKEVGGLLGIPKDEITSPTFVIMKIYKLKPKNYQLDFTHLIHIDAYRLERDDELVKLGWKEISGDPKNLIFIEWPEMVAGLIPKDARKVSFRFVDENVREITISNGKKL
jgi:tRNA threonylcarbamoyladenosine biosynthesis protein TsaE